MVRISGIVMALFIWLLPLSGAYAQATPSACAQKKPYASKITINMETPDPYYDLTKNLAFLNNDGGRSHEEWLKKNKMEGVWSSKHMQTAGRASGGWAAYYSYSLDAEPLDDYWAYGCLYVKELTIDMMFRTLILIPSEYPKGSCEFNLIHPHEMRHYEVNKQVALKMTERLRKDMPQIITMLEAEHVGSDKLKARAEEVKQGIKEMVDVYFKQVMSEEMERLNNLVDTPEEYAGFGKNMRKCNPNNAKLEAKATQPEAQPIAKTWKHKPYEPKVNLFNNIPPIQKGN